MISVKNNLMDINSNKSIIKSEEFFENKKNIICNDEIDKTLFLISEEKNDCLTPQSSSLSPRENGPYEGAEIGNCVDTCSSFDGCDLSETQLRHRQNEISYDSEETEESESETENSTEEEESDENDPDQTNNSIMQERWKELDKYGSSSHILNNNHNANIYRLSAPVNLSSNSSNHLLSENHSPSSNYCLNNTPIHDDTFMLSINPHHSNNALNMSMRHMSTMKPVSSIKTSHFHSIENDPNYHMIQTKQFKSDSMHCRIPHQNSNLMLNNPTLNYDYSKQQRHALNPREFAVNDMRSQFQINMMMNGPENDIMPMSNLSHSHIQDFQCNYCNKCYTNQSSLRSHLKKHMNIDEKKYKCEKCSYSSQYQKNLLKHIHINHEEINDTQHCRCDVCDRMFSSEFLLKDHLRMHTNDNTYQCNQCGKKLKTKLKLRYHADVHNPDKPYVCDIDSCDRAFRTPKYLKNHKDEFHKLQPKKHFCPVDNCKLVFQRKSHLKRHMAMHDGEKNYHCHWPDCNRSFRSQETLNVHLIRHTGEKPFKCELCDYSCRQKASLNYHCRNAHAKDCERLLGLKPFINDGKAPGTRPVGRPPRNRLELNTVEKSSLLKFSGLEENDTKTINHLNGIINNLDKDSNMSEVFKKPSPIDQNDFLKKEIFMIVDDVISNPPRDYGDVDEFSLEELCMVELSIKSKRGRKRKVLKELDALLAQNLNENQIGFEDDEDDSVSYKDSTNNLENDDDGTSRSPINISKIQYTPSLMQSSFVSGTNQACISNQSSLRPMNYSDISNDRLKHTINHRSPITIESQSIHSVVNNNPLKLVKNHISSFASINNSSGHSNGNSSFNASYILGNNNDSGAIDDRSISRSNTPLSSQNKAEHEENNNVDEINIHNDSEKNSPNQQLSWLSSEPANLICHKRNVTESPKFDFSINKSICKSSFSENDTEINDETNSHNLRKQFEKPLNPINNFENNIINKDLLGQVLDDLKVSPNDDEYSLKQFLSPTSTTSLLSVNNSITKVTERSCKMESGLKTIQNISTNPTSLKVLMNENNNQPKSLDSSLWSDSGYSSGHDSSGLNKENAGIANINTICSTISIPSICDRNYKMSSPSSNAAAAFIEKTAAAAEMAALSASAALLNSDFYSTYQQNIGNNRSSGDSNYSPYDGSGFNTELTSMNNICSSMYKSGLEDHLRSLTAFGSKYMENNVYQDNPRSNSNPGPEGHGIGPFSNLWSTSSSSTGDYLAINSNGNSGGPSLNPFDPVNMRSGIGDYCNLAQSPTVAAAADLYSQMTASANYDKYSSLYGCRDSFYDNSTSASRSLSALNNGSSHYSERNYLPPSHPFYHQAASGQYNSRYPPSGTSAADYISMSRQFSSGGSSGNPFSVGNDPYRNSVLHNMSPFNRYPF